MSAPLLADGCAIILVIVARFLGGDWDESLSPVAVDSRAGFFVSGGELVAGGIAERAKPLCRPGVERFARVERDAACVMRRWAIGFQAVPFRQRRGLARNTVHLAQIARGVGAPKVRRPGRNRIV